MWRVLGAGLLIMGLWQHTLQVHKTSTDGSNGVYQLEGEITGMSSNSFNFKANDGQTLVVYGSVAQAGAGTLKANKSGSAWSLAQWSPSDGAVGSGVLLKAVGLNGKAYGQVATKDGNRVWVQFSNKGIFLVK